MKVQSKYRKIQTRNNSVFGHFSRSDCLDKIFHTKTLEPDKIRNIFDRGGSRAAATTKMERFVIIVNGWKPLTVITKRSILNVAVGLDPDLFEICF